MKKADMYLEGIYNTVIVRDIEERQSRPKGNSSKRKINDISLLKRLLNIYPASSAALCLSKVSQII